MTATAVRTFKIGDEVTVDPDLYSASTHGVVFVITKVPTGAREVNYIAYPKDNPTGRGVRARAEHLISHVPSQTPAAPTLRPYVPTPPPGAILRSKGLKSVPDGTIFVVIGDTPKGVKIARLGGDNGRYLE